MHTHTHLIFFYIKWILSWYMNLVVVSLSVVFLCVCVSVWVWLPIPFWLSAPAVINRWFLFMCTKSISCCQIVVAFSAVVSCFLSWPSLVFLVWSPVHCESLWFVNSLDCLLLFPEHAGHHTLQLLPIKVNVLLSIWVFVPQPVYVCLSDG